jgi:uncharacterized membrane protein
MNVVSRRIEAIDVARGSALIGMGLYHLTWDLSYFGLISPGAPFSWQMRVFSHVVACAFLGLAGISLAIAHRVGANWPAFARRIGVVAAAAAVVSAATWLIAPDEPILFGILHCIVAASLIAAPLLAAPGWASAAVGALFVAAPRLYSSATFDPTAMLWLGLGTREPATLDWRPLLPWAGVTLIGLGVGKLALPWLLASPLARWRPRLAPVRALAFGGRHSLAVYLIHQPVFFALLYAGTQWTGAAERDVADRYLAACRPACVEAGGDIEACDKACACVVSKSRDAGLAGSLSSRAATPEDRGKVGAIVQACGDGGK